MDLIGPWRNTQEDGRPCPQRLPDGIRRWETLHSRELIQERDHWPIWIQRKGIQLPQTKEITLKVEKQWSFWSENSQNNDGNGHESHARKWQEQMGHRQNPNVFFCIGNRSVGFLSVIWDLVFKVWRAKNCQPVHTRSSKKIIVGVFFEEFGKKMSPKPDVDGSLHRENMIYGLRLQKSSRIFIGFVPNSLLPMRTLKRGGDNKIHHKILSQSGDFKWTKFDWNSGHFSKRATCWRQTYEFHRRSRQQSVDFRWTQLDWSSGFLCHLKNSCFWMNMPVMFWHLFLGLFNGDNRVSAKFRRERANVVV